MKRDDAEAVCGCGGGGGRSGASAVGVDCPGCERGARARVQGPDGAPVATKVRLSEGWELFQGSLAGPWEVWHSGGVGGVRAGDDAALLQCV